MKASIIGKTLHATHHGGNPPSSDNRSPPAHLHQTTRPRELTLLPKRPSALQCNSSALPARDRGRFPGQSYLKTKPSLLRASMQDNRLPELGRDPLLLPDSMRARVLQDFLSGLKISPSLQSSAPTQHRSLAEMAHEAGVEITQLESHFKKVAAKFCAFATKPENWGSNRAEPVIREFYDLYLLSGQRPLAAPWLTHAGNFDGFVKHFCPQANRKTRAILIEHVQMYMRDRSLHDQFAQLIKLPRTWIRKDAVEEAVELSLKGFPRSSELLVHGTGSAALANIAKHKAISSAALTLQRGDNILTGEYVSAIGKDGKTSVSGGLEGLGAVYASRDGLANTSYTTRRWFDETPVTFGIAEKKQCAYNDAQGHEMYGDQDGIRIGPQVPLENIVAISAPKESEALIRAWAVEHCPHAQFVSYEAAGLLESPDMLGLDPAPGVVA